MHTLYFSPTGKTKSIAKNIAENLTVHTNEPLHEIDLTNSPQIVRMMLTTQK